MSCGCGGGSKYSAPTRAEPINGQGAPSPGYAIQSSPNSPPPTPSIPVAQPVKRTVI